MQRQMNRDSSDRWTETGGMRQIDIDKWTEADRWTATDSQSQVNRDRWIQRDGEKPVENIDVPRRQVDKTVDRAR